MSSPHEDHDLKYENTHDIAGHGHAATDMYVFSHRRVVVLQLTSRSYGHALMTFDPKAESRLRLKIDLYIVPTVALLYLLYVKLGFQRSV